MRGSTVTNTISIAVSSCLLGENVRYDGGNRKNGHVIDLQEQGFELIAVCPEVDIGLPTPREPIDLVFAPTQRPSARLRCDYRVDYSTRLRQAAYRFLGITQMYADLSLSPDHQAADCMIHKRMIQLAVPSARVQASLLRRSNCSKPEFL